MLRSSRSLKSRWQCVPSSKNTKSIREKTFIITNLHISFQAWWFPIYLFFNPTDLSSVVIMIFMPGGKVDLIHVVFFKMIAGYTRRIKKSIRANKYLMFWYDQLKSFIWGASQSYLSCKTSTLIFALKSSIE